ncbi:MAG: D-alanine--D-alanine ligase [Alphaproteobacteria bacterium]
MSKRIAVLMAGISAEREVSLVSGKACARALREAGYEVIEIEVGRDVGALVAALTPAPDAVFNALHGRWGEDGCIQGLLELLHIPYTHSGVMASAMAMDKVVAKRVVAGAGVTSPQGLVVQREDLRTHEPLARPYVIKPVNEGSSVGVRIVREGDNRPAVDDATWEFSEEVLIEPFIPGRELTVAVMGDRALAVTEIQAKSGFYDYDAKYTDGLAEHVIPARIGPQATKAALDAALAAHQALGCRGVSRSDFRYDDTQINGSPTEGGGMGDMYWLEVNTQPGMTPLSLVPEQAAHLGISFSEICAWMVENAACDS